MLKDRLLKIINEELIISKRDIGEYSKIDKKGMHFVIESYKIEGIGNLSVLSMKAMFGLMKMESIIITSLEKDAPLFNIDTIQVGKKVTLLAELYNTQVSNIDSSLLSPLKEIQDKNLDLPLYVTKPHWYDSIKYKESLGYTGKKLISRFEDISEEYLKEFLKILRSTKNISPDLKTPKVNDYVNGLLSSGPTASQFKKLIGEEKTKELFTKYIFGVK
jgi:hypothetical protein